MASACRSCDLCEAEQKIILHHPTVQQGALVGSGVIIPVRHAETVFDLTPDEVLASFALLKEVKVWMDERYRPDGYTSAGAAGRSGDKSPCTPICM